MAQAQGQNQRKRVIKMKERVQKLKMLHDAAGPEMAKFIVNANAAVKEGDPKKLKFIVSGCITALKSYHSVIDELFQEIERLNKVEEEYNSLVQIMDRARKLAYLAAEEDEERPRFKMDANGNLTRLDN